MSLVWFLPLRVAVWSVDIRSVSSDLYHFANTCELSMYCPSLFQHAHFWKPTRIFQNAGWENWKGKNNWVNVFMWQQENRRYEMEDVGKCEPFLQEVRALLGILTGIGKFFKLRYSCSHDNNQLWADDSSPIWVTICLVLMDCYKSENQFEWKVNLLLIDHCLIKSLKRTPHHHQKIQRRGGEGRVNFKERERKKKEKRRKQFRTI